MTSAILPAAASCPIPDSRPPRAGSRSVRFAQARCEIRDGDVLLWRPTSLCGRAIAAATGSIYSHASLAAWFCDSLANLEMVQWAGGRAANLEKQVQRWPGCCDVYRVPVIPEPRWVVRQMFRLVQQDYGWQDFLYIVGSRYLRLPLLAVENTRDPEQPRVCSAAVAWAIRTGAGLRVDPRRNDAQIVPGDLADEDFSRYVLTLIP
jgi:hypothetical protein